MNRNNIGDTASVLTLLQNATVAASGNGTGVDLQPYAGDIVIVLNAKHGTGNADNTADITIEDSADNSSFAAVSGAAFTQVNGTTDSTQIMALNKDSLRRYIRAVKTIAGTTPSFLLACNVVAWKKVLP